MGKKKKKNKEYLKVDMTNGFEIDASMQMENIAFLIGHLLTVLEENGHGSQEEIAKRIVDTNRTQAAEKKQ